MFSLFSIALLTFGLWKADPTILITSGLFAIAAGIAVKSNKD